VQAVRELVGKPQVLLVQILFLVQSPRWAVVVVAEAVGKTMLQQEALEAALVVTHQHQEQEQVGKVTLAVQIATVDGREAVVVAQVSLVQVLQALVLLLLRAVVEMACHRQLLVPQ
jgi:hypothetical protein